MERSSDKHGPREDEEIKQELEGMLRADRPTRAEEGRDPETPADDEPHPHPFSERKQAEPGPTPAGDELE